MHGAIEEARRPGLRRVVLTVMTGNVVAIRLYLSCGFQIEGRRRVCLVVNGYETDEYQLAVLR